MSGCLLALPVRKLGLPFIEPVLGTEVLDGLSDEADACVPVRGGHKMSASPRFCASLS